MAQQGKVEGLVDDVECAALQDLCVLKNSKSGELQCCRVPVSLGPNESSELRFASDGCAHSKLC